MGSACLEKVFRTTSYLRPDIQEHRVELLSALLLADNAKYTAIASARSLVAPSEIARFRASGTRSLSVVSATNCRAVKRSFKLGNPYPGGENQRALSGKGWSNQDVSITAMLTSGRLSGGR